MCQLPCHTRATVYARYGKGIMGSRESRSDRAICSWQWNSKRRLRKRPRYIQQRLVFIGAPATGKTSIHRRLCDGQFTGSYRPTTGALEFGMWKTQVDDCELRLLFYDMSAPYQRCRAVAMDLFMGKELYVIVYSVTDRESFECAQNWLKDVIDFDKAERFLLLGNKCECERWNRQVSYTEAKDFADEHGIMLFEVSAKDGTNLELALMSFACGNL